MDEAIILSALGSGGGGSADAKPKDVVGTVTLNAVTGAITCNKTVTQLAQGHQSGADVYLTLGSKLYRLTSYAQTQHGYQLEFTISDTGNNGIAFAMISAEVDDGDDSFVMSSKTAKDNVYYISLLIDVNYQATFKNPSESKANIDAQYRAGKLLIADCEDVSGNHLYILVNPSISGSEVVSYYGCYVSTMDIPGTQTVKSVFIYCDIRKAPTDKPAFNPATTYHIGDMVTYQNEVYECLEEGVYGEWDATKWKKITQNGLRILPIVPMFGDLSTSPMGG